MKASEVRIEIDTLVLEGVPAHQRQAVARALELELANLIETGGIPASLQAGGAVRSVNGGAIEVRGDDQPERVGAEVARAVYTGLSR